MNIDYQYEFKVYEDAEGKFRWHLIADNGDILCDSGQGYISEDYAYETVGKMPFWTRNAKMSEKSLRYKKLYDETETK